VIWRSPAGGVSNLGYVYGLVPSGLSGRFDPKGRMLNTLDQDQGYIIDAALQVSSADIEEVITQSLGAIIVHRNRAYSRRQCHGLSSLIQ
jgi:hypothetical protein